MTLFILEKVSESLRGELTRWMLEPQTGVFVGTMSAVVREKLWDKIVDTVGEDSGALLVHSHPASEWGFLLRVHGELRRRIVDLDGLQLVQRDHPNPEKAARKLRATIPQGLRRELEMKLAAQSGGLRTWPPDGMESGGEGQKSG